MKFENINKFKINKGCVIWITGLSGAGKTTLAKKLGNNLKKNGVPNILIDGDVMRNILSVNKNNENYSNESRKEMAFKYSQISSELANQGFCVITSVVGMFEDIYLWNRKNLPGYFEVFLDIPLKILKKRDNKGIYKKFEMGKIQNVAGLDLEVQKPAKPNLHIKENSEVDITMINSFVIETMFKNQ